MKDAVEKMMEGIKSLATPLQDLILHEAMEDRDYANKAAAELAALQARVAKLGEKLTAVTVLVNEWRYIAENKPMPTDMQIGIDQCADDLAAALDTQNQRV